MENDQQKAIVQRGKDKKVIHKQGCYAMLDGGMVLTCEEKWNEMKLARLFDDSQAIHISKDGRNIGNSIYLAHLRDHKAFLKKRGVPSGQHLTKKGAQQMANLRVAYRSDKWTDLMDIVEKVA